MKNTATRLLVSTACVALMLGAETTPEPLTDQPLDAIITEAATHYPV